MTYSTVEILPTHVIDHIAAGEVIERPGSVVKELLENCIDAGAQSIQVDIAGGGLTRITVSDDGKGMTPVDATKCYFRHATSKLRTSEELFSVETLGFRGEALSSIASVSRLTISTRQKGEESGFRVIIQGGDVVEEGPAGCPVGTTVNVENLFYNTPARKKFMRSSATEQAHIIDACLRVVLGTESVGLVLTSGNRRLLDIPEGVQESLRIQAALGKRVTGLYPFDSELDGIRVGGFVTKPEIDRGDTKGLWFFVNGRYVRDRMLQRAVLDGYQSILQRGRYPIVVMNVWVNPSVVDVNVHPQKLEVRFSDGGPIFRAVSRAMAMILTEMPWLEGGGFHQARTEEAVVSFFRREANSTDASSEPSKGSTGFWGRGVTPTRIGTSSMQPSADGVPGGRGHLLIGNQFHLSESASGIRIVDLKEAALQWSGVSYNNALEQGEVPKHSLLFPEVLELSADLAVFCEAHWESLGKLGFEVEPVGPKRFALRTIPLAYSGAEPVGLAHACLAQLASLRFDGRLSEDQKEELEKACRGGAEFPLDDGLNPDVLQGLLEWASAQETCSGISKEISPGELKRLLA